MTTTTTCVVREGERERDLDFFVGEEGGRSKEERRRRNDDDDDFTTTNTNTNPDSAAL